MKKNILISLVLIFSLITVLKGQENRGPDLSKISLTFSVSPMFEIPKYSSYSGESYHLSFDQKLNYRFKDHLSLSVGPDFSMKKSNFITGTTPPYENVSEKTYLIELPVQINYHIYDGSKMLDPYIKISVRNAIWFLDYETNTSQVQFNTYSARYALLLDAGIGTWLKLTDKTSLIYEISVGYGVQYPIPRYYYIEGKFGLRYLLK